MIKQANKFEIGEKVLVKCRIVAIKVTDGGFTYETKPYSDTTDKSVFVEPSDIKQRFSK